MNRTVTARIPTKDQLVAAGAVLKQECLRLYLGFMYWTSTAYDSNRGYAIYADSGRRGMLVYTLGEDPRSCIGVVPLAVITV